MTRSTTVAESRAERRRLQSAQRAALSTRTCQLDGYGAVRVKDGYLIASGEGFIHGSPVVCAGLVRAITSQARESFHEALADFLRITWKKLSSFMKDDGAARMGTSGAAHPAPNTRNATS